MNSRVVQLFGLGADEKTVVAVACSLAWGFICCAGASLICRVIHRILLYPYFFSPLRHLPSPKGGYPLVGHGFAEFKMPRGEEYLRFMEETPNNGIIYLRGFFGSEQLLLTSPAALADILSNKAYNFEKPEGDRDFLRRILGSGLITAEGNVHKHQRKQVTPSFSSKQIRNLYPLFWEKSILLTRLVSEELDDSVIDNDSPSISGEIDISKWSQRVSLDIISKAGFDWELDTLRCPDNDMARSFEQIFAVSVENVILFAVSVYGPEWMLEFIPGGISSRFRAATGTLRQLCRVFIQNKQTEIKADWEGSFDILSQLGKRPDVTEELLVNQCLTFLTAGHETVSIALCWAIYLLATHPDTQYRLRAELRSRFCADGAGNSDDMNFLSVLESLPILNGVCNETFRLYPSAPVATRVSVCDTSIIGYEVPKGTRIILAPWAINRSSELWGPDANTFNPSRWIDSNTGKANNTGGATSNYSLLTFLHGPRNCIGQGFAKAELRTLVTAFILAFEVELIHQHHVIMPGGSLSAKPSGGMRLKLRQMATLY